MLYVKTIFSDDRYKIVNTDTGRVVELTLKQAASIVKKGTPIKGLEIVADEEGKPFAISETAYRKIEFPSESELEEYVEENNISIDDIYIVNYRYYILEENKDGYRKRTYHIGYRVGDEIIYVGKDGGYTPYIRGAAEFPVETVYKKAAGMTKYSKTGKIWKVFTDIKR